MQSDLSNPLNQKSTHGQLPKTYLDLIIKVGGGGKYQVLLTISIALSWYVTGILLMSTGFLFLNSSFDCQTKGLLSQDCEISVCSLPQYEWKKYISESDDSFKSLANSFQDYFCQAQVELNLWASSVYLGCFIGYIMVSFFADNYGRKNTAIVSWTICCIGCTLLIFSQNIYMAGVALFLCGFGSDSVLTITGCLFAQNYDDITRQKHYSLSQGSFTLGALFTTLIFYIWKDWQIAAIFSIAIPSYITLFFFIFFVKDSPMYLIKKSPLYALNQLNKIGKINTGDPQILRMEDINSVIQNQDIKQYDKISTPLDPFRYSSLRTITISQAVIGMCTFLMYYGPTLIIDQFGFDVYTSSTLLNIADLMVYYPLSKIIDKIQRKLTCIILFGIATFISGLLIFIQLPQDCDKCSTIYLQLVLIFIFRFCVSMQFALMYVYQSELYPTRVRNIAGGVLGAFGTMTSTISPIVMGQITRAKINHFILFTILGLIATGSYTLGPQTLNVPCPQQIQQIQFQKDKKSSMKKSNYSAIKLHAN